jgi:hypothetical protein
VPRRSTVSTFTTWRQVSPPKAPAFIASAPPTVPGMPLKNSAGPRSQRAHCLASARTAHPPRQYTSRSPRRSSALERIAGRDHHAPHAAVAHQQVAAEAQPQQRHFGRQDLQEGSEICPVARHEEQVGRAAHMPGGMARQRLAQGARARRIPVAA